MLDISEQNKEIFKEQIKVSREALQKFEKDGSEEGTKGFYRNAEILEDIFSRLTIAEQSQKNAEDVRETLGNL